MCHRRHHHDSHGKCRDSISYSPWQITRPARVNALYTLPPPTYSQEKPRINNSRSACFLVVVAIARKGLGLCRNVATTPKARGCSHRRLCSQKKNSTINFDPIACTHTHTLSFSHTPHTKPQRCVFLLVRDKDHVFFVLDHRRHE